MNVDGFEFIRKIVKNHQSFVMFETAFVQDLIDQRRITSMYLLSMVRILLRQSVTFMVLEPCMLCLVFGMLFKLPVSEVNFYEHSFSIRESLWWSIYILPG